MFNPDIRYRSRHFAGFPIMHCIWGLPAGDCNFSKRWGSIKGIFTKSYLAMGPALRLLKGESIRKKLAQNQ